MSEPEKPVHLTYTQLVNILCVLVERIEMVESLMRDLLKELDAQTEFQNYQILLTRMENIRENNRTPRGRLNDLENQFKGLIQFVNQREPRKPKRQSKWS